jgi:hypothetical protein
MQTLERNRHTEEQEVMDIGETTGMRSNRERCTDTKE